MSEFHDKFPIPPSVGPQEPPAPPRPLPGLGPVYPPHPPKPDFPGWCPPPMPPQPPFMPPAPSVVQGESLYEAVNALTERVNLCIHTYNDVMARGYKTLQDMQLAAQTNGSYYTKGEVWVEEGYSAEQSASFKIVHKNNLDRRGEPIRIQLHLAYNNTTNSKIEQDIFSASQITFADKCFTAQPMQPDGWYGNVIYHGAPLPSASMPTLYTMGFTRSGVMKVYSNSVDPNQMLADTVENAMGVSGVLIQNGQVLGEDWMKGIPNYDTQMTRICVGQNSQTREVIFLITSAENDTNKKGMTSLACAEILRGYGCDIAVEMHEGANTGATDKGQLMFEPVDMDVPECFAYWYITRKDYYKNDYQHELAKMVQLYGQELWRIHLSGEKIDSFDKRLKQEILDRTQGDANLSLAIKGETTRAENAEDELRKLIEAGSAEAGDIADNLAAEIARAKAAEAALQTNINAEQTRAEQAEANLQTNINAEQTRAEAAEEQLSKDITAAVDAERARAEKAEGVLQDNIDNEQARAEAAEAQLGKDITAAVKVETDRATAAENLLQQNITAEKNRAEAEENHLESLITAETQRAENAEQTLDTKFTNEVTRIDTLYQTLTNQVTTMDTAVTEMQKTINEIEVTLNNMKTLISESQTLVREVKNLLDAIENGTADIPYVKTAGDTMTGPLVLPGNATANLQAVPKQQLDTAVNNLQTQIETINTEIDKLEDGSTALPYVKKTGDIMSGTLQINPRPSGSDSYYLQFGNSNTNAQIYANVGSSDAPYFYIRAHKTNQDSSIIIRNVQNPKEPSDAANKAYVEAEMDAAVDSAKQYTEDMIDAMDAVIDGKVSKSGDTMTGSLTFHSGTTDTSKIIFGDKDKTLNLYANISGNAPILYLYNTSTGASSSQAIIRNIATPVQGVDAANKSYVDTAVGRYLPLTGGTLTGKLNIQTQDATGIQFNRTLTSGSKDGNALEWHTFAYGTKLYPSNGTVSADGSTGVPRMYTQIQRIDATAWSNSPILWMVADGVDNTDAVNVRQLNNKVAGYLPLTGGIISGNLTLTKATSQSHQIYFQAQGSGDTGILSAYINFVGNRMGTPNTSHFWVLGDQNTGQQTTFRNLRDPGEDTEVATKHYVDQAVAGVGGGDISIVKVTSHLYGDDDINKDSSFVANTVTGPFLWAFRGQYTNTTQGAIIILCTSDNKLWLISKPEWLKDFKYNGKSLVSNSGAGSLPNTFNPNILTEYEVTTQGTLATVQSTVFEYIFKL